MTDRVDPRSDHAAWQATLPRKRMGAGVLVRDGDDRVLLVEPTYKPDWEIPGGTVEVDESPRTGCAREVREELGLDLAVGRLLVFEWQPPARDRTESLLFVYDGGVLPPDAEVTLPADELRSYRFVALDDCDALVSPRLGGRLRAAMTALTQGVLVELESGVRV
ncbi:MAG TPA: NUDIX hydrolase [Actinomycetes bacterium]|jgi:8-oxo-dGTP pyrophosphatase MutT (NUDIX family)|nr:NUDIX hydrolase [Actinomycetes bacterium]